MMPLCRKWSWRWKLPGLNLKPSRNALSERRRRTERRRKRVSKRRRIRTGRRRTRQQEEEKDRKKEEARQQKEVENDRMKEMKEAACKHVGCDNDVWARGVCHKHVAAEKRAKIVT